MKNLKSLIQETVVIKSSQRRRISKLELENGKLEQQLEDSKANELDAIDRMNVMKDEFLNEHSKLKDLEKEKYEMEQKYEEQIRLLQKQIKKLEDNEKKSNIRGKKQA